MRRCVLSLLLSVLAGCSSGGVEVSSAWVRMPPPGADTLAAYLTVANHGRQVARITGVQSRQFERAMLHRTAVDDGIAKMIHLPALDVPPGETVTLTPGAVHIMLVRPLEPVREGDAIALTVAFADGSSIDVTATVRRQ